MNFVYLSPEFPVTSMEFCKQLHYKGVTVLGIGESPYDLLHPDLKNALTEYYRVDLLQNYDQVLRAVAFLTFRYGKIDWLESNNEFWLELDAQLRKDFNISTGFHTEDMEKVKRKSKMKEVYREAGIPVARGQLLTNLEDALDFVKEVGYPIIAKPDIGVGASSTYKFRNEDELRSFFENLPPFTMLMEEFVPGVVITYDGIIDKNGDPVFEASLECPVSIMEMTNSGLETLFYSTPEPIEELLPYGRKLMKAFGIKSRFVHCEFFRMYEDKEGLGKAGDILGLEVNMRPSGGFAPHMYNLSNNTDVFKLWADMITEQPVVVDESQQKYLTLFIGRRNYVNYKHSEEEIESRYHDKIYTKIYPSAAENAVMSDVVYIYKTETVEDLEQFAQFATEHA